MDDKLKAILCLQVNFDFGRNMKVIQNESIGSSEITHTQNTLKIVNIPTNYHINQSREQKHQITMRQKSNVTRNLSQLFITLVSLTLISVIDCQVIDDIDDLHTQLKPEIDGLRTSSPMGGSFKRQVNWNDRSAQVNGIIDLKESFTARHFPRMVELKQKRVTIWPSGETKTAIESHEFPRLKRSLKSSRSNTFLETGRQNSTGKQDTNSSLIEQVDLIGGQNYLNFGEYSIDKSETQVFQPTNASSSISQHKRNLNAALEAQAKLELTLNQLHFNKSLALERTAIKETQNTTLIESTSNLLSSSTLAESIADLGSFTPIVNNLSADAEARNGSFSSIDNYSQQVNVSPTRAPSSVVEYPNHNYLRPISVDPLDVAADEIHQQSPSWSSASSPASRRNSSRVDWGLRKSIKTPSKSRHGNYDNATTDANSYEDIVTWTPAAGPAAYSANSNFLVSNEVQHSADSLNNSQTDVESMASRPEEIRELEPDYHSTSGKSNEFAATNSDQAEESRITSRRKSNNFYSSPLVHEGQESRDLSIKINAMAQMNGTQLGSEIIPNKPNPRYKNWKHSSGRKHNKYSEESSPESLSPNEESDDDEDEDVKVDEVRNETKQDDEDIQPERQVDDEGAKKFRSKMNNKHRKFVAKNSVKSTDDHFGDHRTYETPNVKKREKKYKFVKVKALRPKIESEVSDVARDNLDQDSNRDDREFNRDEPNFQWSPSDISKPGDITQNTTNSVIYQRPMSSDRSASESQLRQVNPRQDNSLNEFISQPPVIKTFRASTQDEHQNVLTAPESRGHEVMNQRDTTKEELTLAQVNHEKRHQLESTRESNLNQWTPATFGGFAPQSKLPTNLQQDHYSSRFNHQTNHKNDQRKDNEQSVNLLAKQMPSREYLSPQSQQNSNLYSPTPVESKSWPQNQTTPKNLILGSQPEYSNSWNIQTYPYPQPARNALDYFSYYSQNNLRWPNQASNQNQPTASISYQQQESNEPLNSVMHLSTAPAASGPIDISQSYFHGSDYSATATGVSPKRVPEPISIDQISKTNMYQIPAPQLNKMEASKFPSITSQSQQPVENSEHLIQRGTRNAPSSKVTEQISDQKQEPDMLTINVKTHGVVGPNQLFWEAAAQQQQQHLQATGKIPLSNGHHPLQHRELPRVELPSMRRPLSVRMTQEQMLAGASHTNGHAYPGRYPQLGATGLIESPFGSSLADLSQLHSMPSNPNELSYFDPQGIFPVSYGPAAGEHQFPNFMAAAAAMQMSTFQSPDTTMALRSNLISNTSSNVMNEASLSPTGRQNLKKGPAIISAEIPLATPGSVSDPFGWPMGFGSEAAKTLLKVNHVAPPPTYLIQAAKVTNFPPALGNLDDQLTQSSTRATAWTIPNSNPFLADHQVSTSWIPTSTGGQNSVDLVKNNVKHVTQPISLRPPAPKRTSIWRRLRLLRMNRNTSGLSESRSGRYKRGIIEQVGRLMRFSQPKKFNSSQSLENSAKAHLALVDIGDASQSIGSQFIPLIDNQNLIDNIQNDVLAQALSFEQKLANQVRQNPISMAKNQPQTSNKTDTQLASSHSMLVPSYAPLNGHIGETLSSNPADQMNSFRPESYQGLESQLSYPIYETSGQLRPPVNEPVVSKSNTATSTREKFRQLSKDLIRSSTKPLTSFIKIRSFAGYNPQSSNKTSRPSEKQENLAASSQHQISIAQKLATHVSPSVMMNHQLGSIENFNRLANPILEWYQHQNHPQAMSFENPKTRTNVQMLPLVDHTSQPLSPYTFVADGSRPIIDQHVIMRPPISPYSPIVNIRSNNSSSPLVAATNNYFGNRGYLGNNNNAFTGPLINFEPLRHMTPNKASRSDTQSHISRFIGEHLQKTDSTSNRLPRTSQLANMRRISHEPENMQRLSQNLNQHQFQTLASDTKTMHLMQNRPTTLRAYSGNYVQQPIVEQVKGNKYQQMPNNVANSAPTQKQMVLSQKVQGYFPRQYVTNQVYTKQTPEVTADSISLDAALNSSLAKIATRNNLIRYADTEIFPASSNQQVVETLASNNGELFDESKLIQSQNQLMDSTPGSNIEDTSNLNSLISNSPDELQIPFRGQLSSADSSKIPQLTDQMTSGEFTSEQQQQFQNQLLNQQQQLNYFQPSPAIFGSSLPRPRLPKLLPSINSMASKFRQHLFQTFRLNQLAARWPQSLAPSSSGQDLSSGVKFNPSSFMLPSLQHQRQQKPFFASHNNQALESGVTLTANYFPQSNDGLDNSKGVRLSSHDNSNLRFEQQPARTFIMKPQTQIVRQNIQKVVTDKSVSTQRNQEKTKSSPNSALDDSSSDNQNLPNTRLVGTDQIVVLEDSQQTEPRGQFQILHNGESGENQTLVHIVNGTIIGDIVGSNESVLAAYNQEQNGDILEQPQQGEIPGLNGTLANSQDYISSNVTYISNTDDSSQSDASNSLTEVNGNLIASDNTYLVEDRPEPEKVYNLKPGKIVARPQLFKQGYVRAPRVQTNGSLTLRNHIISPMADQSADDPSKQSSGTRGKPETEYLLQASEVEQRESPMNQTVELEALEGATPIVDAENGESYEANVNQEHEYELERLQVKPVEQIVQSNSSRQTPTSAGSRFILRPKLHKLRSGISRVAKSDMSSTSVAGDRNLQLSQNADYQVIKASQIEQQPKMILRLTNGTVSQGENVRQSRKSSVGQSYQQPEDQHQESISPEDGSGMKDNLGEDQQQQQLVGIYESDTSHHREPNSAEQPKESPSEESPLVDGKIIYTEPPEESEIQQNQWQASESIEGNQNSINSSLKPIAHTIDSNSEKSEPTAKATVSMHHKMATTNSSRFKPILAESVEQPNGESIKLHQSTPSIGIENYELVDQPIVLTGGSTPSPKSLSSGNITQQQLNFGLETPDRPVVFVSVKPEKQIVHRKRPLKVPSRSQMRVTGAEWAIATSRDQQTTPGLSGTKSKERSTLGSQAPAILDQRLSVSESGASEQVSSLASLSAILQQTNSTSARIKVTGNHNMKPTKSPNSSIVASLVRDSFTRPTKAKIRWQGMSSPTNKTQRVDSNSSESNRSEQAWIVGRMTHQSFGSQQVDNSNPNQSNSIQGSLNSFDKTTRTTMTPLVSNGAFVESKTTQIPKEKQGADRRGSSSGDSVNYLDGGMSAADLASRVFNNFAQSPSQPNKRQVNGNSTTGELTPTSRKSSDQRSPANHKPANSESQVESTNGKQDSRTAPTSFRLSTSTTGSIQLAMPVTPTPLVAVTPPIDGSDTNTLTSRDGQLAASANDTNQESERRMDSLPINGSDMNAANNLEFNGHLEAADRLSTHLLTNNNKRLLDSYQHQQSSASLRGLKFADSDESTGATATTIGLTSISPEQSPRQVDRHTNDR